MEPLRMIGFGLPVGSDWIAFSEVFADNAVIVAAYRGS